MAKRIVTFLSVLCLLLLIAPLLAGGAYFPFMLEISLFAPIILAAAGLFFGIFGIKGLVRLLLVAANFFMLGFYVIITLIGLYGFQQP